MMKRTFFLALLLISGILSAAGKPELKLSLRPAAPVVGEPVDVIIEISGSSETPKNIDLPRLDGKASWGRSTRLQHSFSNINGVQKSVQQLMLQLTPHTTGKLTIPPVKLLFPSGDFSTAPFTVDVSGFEDSKSNSSRTLPEPSGVFTTTPDRPLYPGEMISLNMNIFLPEAYELYSIDNASITGMDGTIIQRDPRSHQQLRLGRAYPETVNSVNGIIYPVSGTARVTAAGEFHPQAVFSLRLRERHSGRRRGFDDEEDIFAYFMGPGNGFGQSRTIRVVLKDNSGFKVLPLPPPPAGFSVLDLNGAWNISATLTPRSCRSGELAELELKLSPAAGNSDTENFSPVQLQFPGFRVYPPQIRRLNGALSLRYVIIPLAPGEKTLPLKLANFDPASGKYRTFEKLLTLAVTPGSANVPAASPSPSGTETTSMQTVSPETPLPPPEELCYLKSVPDETVLIPLFANQKRWASILVIAGFALLLTDLFCRRFFKNGNAAARKHRRELKAKVRNIISEAASANDISEVFSRHGVAEIAELCGLPPGATAQEIAGKINDPELKEFFCNTGNSSFAPGTGGTEKNSPELRKKLLAFLKHLALFTIMVFLASPTVADTVQKHSAYDSGNYAQASEEFRRALDKHKISPSLCYNIGCAEFNLGRLPEARLWFTRALLLAPGDPECIANLRLTERRLQLPPEKSFIPSDFLSRIRDSRLRPDQYIMLSAVGFFLLCVLITLRGTRWSAWRWGGAAVILFVSIVALTAAFGQSDSTYSPNNLIITSGQCELRSMPMKNSGTALLKLSGGESAVLLEKRGSWLHINVDGKQGWIEDFQAQKVFPYGIL